MQPLPQAKIYEMIWQETVSISPKETYEFSRKNGKHTETVRRYLPTLEKLELVLDSINIDDRASAVYFVSVLHRAFIEEILRSGQ